MASTTKLVELFNADAAVAAAATTTAFVEAAYANLLNLSGDFSNKDERVGYWVGQINSGEVSKADFAATFLAAAAVKGDLLTNAEFAANTETLAAIAKLDEATLTTLAEVQAGLAAAVEEGEVSGQSFALTSAADVVTGTSTNDTINGYINTTTGSTTTTFSGADSVDAGAGSDTFNLTVEGANAAGSLTGATLNNIEHFVIKDVNTSGASTYDFAGVTTEESVTVKESTQAVNLNNLAANTVVGVQGNGSITNGATTAAYVASATAGTLNVSGGTTAGAVAVNGTGLATLTVNSTGASNTIGALSTTGAATTVNVNASTSLTTTGLTVATNTATQSLVIAGSAADQAATGSAAANSAVVLGALDADFASIDASGLTAGGVSATLSATTAATFVGGAGSDRVTTSTSGQTGSIDAGEGTDTLILNASVDIDTTAEGAIYKNFEVLQADDGTALDMDLLTASTIGAVIINDASAGATAVTDMTAAQAADVTFVDFNDAATLGVKNATQVGTNDVLNITISDGDTTSSETLIAAATDGADWTIAGVETVNLTVVDDFDADALNSITGMTTLTATGAGDVDIITGAADMGVNGTVDFSGLTGTVIFNAAALATNAFSYTGGTGVDTVTDNVIGGNLITTGAGNDVINLTDKTGGSAATVINAGAGMDTINVSMLGNVARDGMKFVYAAGDSVSDASTSGISSTLTDVIDNLDGAALSATAGSSVEFDTEVQASAVTAGTTDVVLGSTTVANAGDFFVNIESATVTWIYQDTDGDKIIEAGEFAVALTGIQNSTLAAGEFSVVNGDLILATA